MFTAGNIALIQHVHALQPQLLRPAPAAIICNHCSYINETSFLYCTNCGHPLQQLAGSVYHQRMEQRTTDLLKARNAVLAARVVLYVIASFLSLGFFFIFAASNQKYIVVAMALLFAALFFTLAYWSYKNPFAALLISFVILLFFSTINIFKNLATTAVSFRQLTGIFICAFLLIIILRGVKGAYHINLINEEL